MTFSWKRNIFVHVICVMEVCLANITLSISDELLAAGRDYAVKHNISLNALIRKLLKRVVDHSSQDWLAECFRKMDQAVGDSESARWSREELYDV